MTRPLTPEDVNRLLGLTTMTEREAWYGPGWVRCVDARAEIDANEAPATQPGRVVLEEDDADA